MNMYSRNQSSQAAGISVPDNYDGVAFTEQKPEQSMQAESSERSIRVLGSPAQDVKMSPSGFKKEEAEEACDIIKEESAEQAGLFSGILNKIPTLGSIFGSGRLFNTEFLKIPKFGVEEILLLGIALFLFFSKSGDKECAIMLALLIFVSN